MEVILYNDLLLNRIAGAPIENPDGRIQELIDEIEELKSLLSPEAQELIRHLRPRLVTDDVYEQIDEQASLGDRLADRLAAFAGSWKFIIGFALLMAVWIAVNYSMGAEAFDPFPFILLNLTLSTLAALQAPVILMSQNRQATKDRAVAQNDYHVNLKNEVEIADLHRKIDALAEALSMQTRMVNALVEARRKELSATVRVMESALPAARKVGQAAAD
ncbi:MAG: DUF1003 domain-containing protein [Chloroflexi bacterium]|nr:DUF1003 domain-containing protein [Chloroflexota bacterium]MDL1883380.1 DUF1003 domain-containing protein [Anaerolineae bacterium CFX8]